MAKAKAKSNASSTVKVRFIKSPTGVLNLAYFEGEEAEFEVKQAAELIHAGFAEEIN